MSDSSHRLDNANGPSRSSGGNADRDLRKSSGFGLHCGPVGRISPRRTVIESTLTRGSLFGIHPTRDIGSWSDVWWSQSNTVKPAPIGRLRLHQSHGRTW